MSLRLSEKLLTLSESVPKMLKGDSELVGVPTGVRVNHPKFTYENDAFLGVWAFTAPGKIEILASYPRQHCSQYLQVLPEILGHLGRDLGGVPTGVRVGRPLNAPMKTMIF